MIQVGDKVSTNPKPGLKSTEFYGHGIATILGAVASTGFLNPDMSKALNTAAEQMPQAVIIIDSIVDGIMQLGGLLLAVISQIKYGAGRAGAKKAPERIYIKK